MHFVWPTGSGHITYHMLIYHHYAFIWEFSDLGYNFFTIFRILWDLKKIKVT